jgi:VanZ family protein
MAPRDSPLLKTVPIVLLLSAVVEVQQAYFARGHCRVRDMLPNMIGIALGIALHRSILAVRKARSSRSPAEEGSDASVGRG